MYSDIDLLCGAKQNTLSGGRATITILWPHRGTNCYSETSKKMPFLFQTKNIGYAIVLKGISRGQQPHLQNKTLHRSSWNGFA